MRINARLDEQAENSLKFIKQETGKNVTQIIKDLLEAQAHQLRRQKHGNNTFDTLLKSDFIGCVAGPEDLSTDYKQYLSEGLENKHDFG